MSLPKVAGCTSSFCPRRVTPAWPALCLGRLLSNHSVSWLPLASEDSESKADPGGNSDQDGRRMTLDCVSLMGCALVFYWIPSEGLQVLWLFAISVTWPQLSSGSRTGSLSSSIRLMVLPASGCFVDLGDCFKSCPPFYYILLVPPVQLLLYCHCYLPRFWWIDYISLSIAMSTFIWFQIELCFVLFFLHQTYWTNAPEIWSSTVSPAGKICTHFGQVNL